MFDSLCYVADSYTAFSMKMPATTNVKVEAKVPQPEVGDAAKQCISCLEKKMRNLEKRKTRIEQSQEKASKGSKLEKEQEVALRLYEQVAHDLEFARELYKQFQQIYSENEKISKKAAKREKAERQLQEIKRVSEILQLQSLLDMLGGDKVREDFKTGQHGALVLSEDRLNQLDELYQVISPSREESGYSQHVTTAAEHLVNILEGKDRQVVGTTYKEIKDLISTISECGYFDKVSKETDKPAAEETESGETEETEEETAEVEPSAAGNTEEETTPAQQDEQTSLQTPSEQQPVDLTVGQTQPTSAQEDLPTQPLNTLEQDAFFGTSSTTYQVESEPQLAQAAPQQVDATGTQQRSAPDFQAFTTNRPFQFIQTSYIMPDVAADPAVLAAQPAGASGLQFMSQSYEASAPKQHPPQQPPTQPPLHTQQPAFSSQQYAQAGLHQAFKPVSGEEAMGSDLRSQRPYDIPPNIPMPPSQMQDQQSQLEQQQQAEKKFQMNASAPVFQSMFSPQVSPGQQGSSMGVPPPSVGPQSHGMGDQPSLPQQQQEFPVQPSQPAVAQVQPTHTNGDYGPQSGAAGDFYQGNGFNGNFNRGGRGGFRGGRGSNGGQRGGVGSGPGMQNGFNNRGGPANNGARGGRGNYQGYPPNSGYRPDGYQGYNAGGAPNAATGGFGNQVYNKRGGGGGNMAGGQGFTRGGGAQQNMARGAGGMRGGMPRGGQGAPRGNPRGAHYSRPQQAQ